MDSFDEVNETRGVVLVSTSLNSGRGCLDHPAGILHALVAYFQFRGIEVIKYFAKKHLERLVGSKNALNFFFRIISQNGARLYTRSGDIAFVYDPSEFIGRNIFENGEFQRAEIENVAKIAVTERRNGGVMLEIGANIGTSSIYAGLTGQFTKIVAVEADARNFDLLCTNIRINNLQDIIIPIYAGVSDHTGEGRLQRHALHGGMSTLEPTEDFFARGTVSGEQTVSLRTADDILKDAGIRPEDVTLVWMDIEGHEPKAFVGMSARYTTHPDLAG